VRIGCSTTPGAPLAPELARLAGLGFDFAEVALTFDDARLERLETGGLPIETAHLPDVDFGDADLARASALADLAIAAGARTLVIHGAVRGGEGAPLERKAAWLEDLAAGVAAKGARLAFEHTDEDAATIGRILDLAPTAGFCLDTGHANLMTPDNRSLDLIETFADRLIEVHLSDNRGGREESDDLHLPLGEGTVRFGPIARALKARRWDGPVVVEVWHGGYEDRGRALALARRLLA